MHEPATDLMAMTAAPHASAADDEHALDLSEFDGADAEGLTWLIAH